VNARLARHVIRENRADGAMVTRARRSHEVAVAAREAVPGSAYAALLIVMVARDLCEAEHVMCRRRVLVILRGPHA